VVRALQNVGVAGICLVLIWLITRGELVTRRAHEEVVAAKDAALADLHGQVDQLRAQVDRYSAILGALGRDTGDDD